MALVAAHKGPSESKARRGTFRWKALRIWKGLALARRAWQGSLAADLNRGESRVRVGGDRKCQWPRHSAQVAQKTRHMGSTPHHGATLWGGRESKLLQVSRRQIAVSLRVDGPSGSSSLDSTSGIEKCHLCGKRRFHSEGFRTWRAKASRLRIEGCSGSRDN
jgi:hypothetical protein